MNYMTFAATTAEVLSLLALVYSLVQAKNAIVVGNTEEAHRSATNLMLEYYNIKAKYSEESFLQKITGEVDAYRVLFIAESIFVMMKSSSRKEEWLCTVEFLLHEVSVLNGKALPLETYDVDFREIVEKCLDVKRSHH